MCNLILYRRINGTGQILQQAKEKVILAKEFDYSEDVEKYHSVFARKMNYLFNAACTQY